MKVFALTGKRGGYDAMHPMLLAMQEDPFFDLTVVYTDMHLSAAFGMTGQKIAEDFPNSIPIPLPSYGSSKRFRMVAIAEFQKEWTMSLTFHKPDLVLLYGDRAEVLSAALVASQCGVAIAHLQGGDTSGTVDNITRGAVSKLADLHYVSCKQSADRLKLQDERVGRIAVVGDNHIDPIIKGLYDQPSTIQKEIGIIEGTSGIILLHPETPSDGENEYLMSKVCAAADFLDNLIIIYPCSDPGYKGIVGVIEDMEGERGIHIFKNLPSRIFLGLMASVDVLIGNSSCGIIEAPYFRLGVVNIGDRQKGRLQAGNCINVHSECSTADIEADIRCAIEETYENENYPQLYGDGTAGDKIIADLKNIEWYVAKGLRGIKK